MRAISKGLIACAAGVFFAGLANAGILTGTVTNPPPSVNLTTEGTADWIHWGLTTTNDVNRKATGGSQISNVALIGTGTTKARLTDSPSVYSWTGGTPTATATNSPTGVYINNFSGAGRGFQFTAPADTTARTLEVFLGEFDASGTFEASLSDGSAATYTNILAGGANQTVQGMYTLNYSANSPGQTLTVKWTETSDLGQFDNVTIQAAGLKLSVVPEPATLGLIAAGAALRLCRRKRLA
jgi:PEP-CTERM motif-containing protein